MLLMWNDPLFYYPATLSSANRMPCYIDCTFAVPYAISSNFPTVSSEIFMSIRYILCVIKWSPTTKRLLVEEVDGTMTLICKFPAVTHWVQCPLNCTFMSKNIEVALSYCGWYEQERYNACDSIRGLMEKTSYA